MFKEKNLEANFNPAGARSTNMCSIQLCNVEVQLGCALIRIGTVITDYNPHAMYGALYLCHRAYTPLKLQLVHTLIGRLPHLVTFVNLPLPATASNPHPVYHVTLLCLVAETTGFVRSGWAGCPVD